MNEHERTSVLLYRASADFTSDGPQSEQAHSAQDLNRLALQADAEFLAIAPSDARLSGRLLDRASKALDQAPKTQAVYPAHGDGNSALRRVLAQGAFHPASLTRRNAVGPVAIVRRSAWLELGGLHSGFSIPMALWDFWLRLVMAHPAPGTISRLPELLALAPAQFAGSTRGRSDGKGKAMLVVHTPGVFEGDVCRWALALLRGESWARPCAPGIIPTAAEVRRMWEAGGTRTMEFRQTA